VSPLTRLVGVSDLGKHTDRIGNKVLLRATYLFTTVSYDNSCTNDDDDDDDDNDDDDDDDDDDDVMKILSLCVKADHNIRYICLHSLF
jgi:hypothetical protein